MRTKVQPCQKPRPNLPSFRNEAADLRRERVVSPQIAAAFRRFCGDPAAYFRLFLGKFAKWICV